ncbi:MAG: ABC transporter permease, partial [Pseudomonadota bacterium]
RGTVLGAVLGVALITITSNGLNLLGVTPYAFQMVIGLVILVAIIATNLQSSGLLAQHRRMRS